MADITSLGIHVPVALPFLIEEGILPEDPKKELYEWETYVSRGGECVLEEELLATRHCVVWSQGRYIRNVYRFELEGEDVVRAILTGFPTQSPRGHERLQQQNGAQSGDGVRQTREDRLDLTRKRHRETSDGHSTSQDPRSNRAIVVFLKSKAHIYFLHGASHIVDLPFEIGCAFPAPRGLVLQRKASPTVPIPATPQLPTAPPNSFFSSQPVLSSSYLQSPTLAKSFASTQPFRPSPLGGKKGLDALFQDALGNEDQAEEEDVASLYTLTSPLADLGVVAFSLQHQRPRLSTKTPPALNVEFETLGAAEAVVYVSSGDELANDAEHGYGPLMLIVTTNKDLQIVTLWHAWYIEERSLASLMKQRAAHKAAKARRRSSFLSAGIGTGTATPAARQRENPRESFAALQQPAVVSSRKRTKEQEEDAMASQMDPDYQPGVSQKTARESRRISSLNADVRASQSAANASFGGPGGRRNTSFGGINERKSIGHRKSRGSTPGSLYGRSFGVDDDLMDLDNSMDAEGDESVESVVRHIRATFEAAGSDSLFGGVDEGFKKELAVRKLHSMPMPSATSPSRASSPLPVVTLRDAHTQCSGESPRLNVYIHDCHSKALSCLELMIRKRALWPELDSTTYAAIPVVIKERKLGQCAAIVKLTHGNTEVIHVGGTGVILSVEDQTPWPMDVDAPYRMYDPVSLSSASGPIDSEVGRSRTLQGPSRGTCSLTHSGISGRFDEVGPDRVNHRRQMKLEPSDIRISDLLRLCRLALPARNAQMVSGLYFLSHSVLVKHPERLSSTAQSMEWVAFATTVFGFAIHLVDDKARAALKMSQVAAGKAPHSKNLRLERQQRSRQLLRRSAWGWMSETLPSSSGFGFASSGRHDGEVQKDQFPTIASSLADELMPSVIFDNSPVLEAGSVATLLLGLHVYAEEQKLCTLSSGNGACHALAAIIAQMAAWIGLPSWSYGPQQYYNLQGANEESWAFVDSRRLHAVQMPLMDEPVGVYQWFEHALNTRSEERYPSLDIVASLVRNEPLTEASRRSTSLTPRIVALSDMLESTRGLNATPMETVQLMAEHGLIIDTMETLPEAIAAPFKEAIMACERDPPTAWSADLLTLVGRQDLTLDERDLSGLKSKSQLNTSSGARDVQSICHALDHHPHSGKTKEASRHAVSQLIFSEDRRLVEATSLMHFNSVQMAECPKQPDWSDAYHFEQQRKLMQWVTARMIALPAGDAILHFDSQTPLLTDKYHLPGFSSSCLMQPMGHTLTTDRSGLTEEKVNWAYFHAGASTGLRISRKLEGIDTSWIAFNKPNDLTNRHAGLLLALGLGGHLRHLAKWLSFKYLTPKHTMTSVGLLLGLSASYMGTMDGLITRMLSVHITRMLPPGAAELNVSPTTQTAGLMGIGLLYYNTQHRRMSEIMLSEVEHMELEDPDSGPDPLRDESYRLAAGFALGFINLGKGRDLRGLHGMYLPERLLAVAVGPRPVSAVHVFDRATAGAVMAIALVYMKSEDSVVARKIDIPDTEAQFDHVRPDVLMLRAMAKHIILWDNIKTDQCQQDSSTWMQRSLPACYVSRFRDMHSTQGRYPLKSSDVPFFNITTGLLWALSLKYAGSSNTTARDEILNMLDCLYKIKGGPEAYYYDAKLARCTVRRCIDVLALSAAVVMAGSGDLKTFRYLRRLHGRIDAETPYGSHLAAHLAIGVLFLGGGTYTLGTSNLAIASLICAFYPLFPTDVHDNHVHLQAFRHLWVFAAEARCLVIEDIDTQRPISMPMTVTIIDGSVKAFTAPCLLPDLNTISTIQTNDPSYWRVTLDFSNNPGHLTAFKHNQRVFVRRCPASEAHSSVFSATFAALSLQPSTSQSQHIWQSIFSLPIFKDLDKAEIELILPPDVHSSMHTDERETVVDDRLVLSKAPSARESDALWNLRLLFAWAERARDKGDGRLKWIGSEIVEALRAKVEQRPRSG